MYRLEEMLLALSPKAASEARCSAEEALTLRRGLKRVAEFCRKELRDVFELYKVALVGELTLAARFGNRVVGANTVWEEKDRASAFALYSATEEALAPIRPAD